MPKEAPISPKKENVALKLCGELKTACDQLAVATTPEEKTFWRTSVGFWSRVVAEGKHLDNLPNPPRSGYTPQ